MQMARIGQTDARREGCIQCAGSVLGAYLTTRICALLPASRRHAVQVAALKVSDLRTYCTCCLLPVIICQDDS